MPRRRGTVALALLLLTFVLCIPARNQLASELRHAAALIDGGNRAVLIVALSAFVLVPMSAALTWCFALAPDRGRLPLVDGCCRYGVGSLVNTFIPARAGDAVRLVLFARLLGGTPRRTLALRFGGLELARIAVFGSLAIMLVEPRAALPAGIAGCAFCVRRGYGRLALAVGTSAAVRIAAFAVALTALGVASPLSGAFRIVPALEIAAIAPLSPGNIAFASMASAAALGTRGMPLSSGLAIGVALHVLESAGAVCFGVTSVVTMAARRIGWSRADAVAWLRSPA